MESYYQYPSQNRYWHNTGRSHHRKVTQKKTRKCATMPQLLRAMLIIDGAYFEQGTTKYMLNKFGINLFDTTSPDALAQNFVDTIEEWLNVQWIHRHFITALFDENSAQQTLRDYQNAMIDTLEKEWMFQIDCREFKNMQVYCTNRQCTNSVRPINRKVQAEVDVAIATKVLSMAFKDEYDILIAITGDRDFKDWFATVVADAGKPVKIWGFAESIYQEYYDTRYGWEVLQAETVWDRAIGKSLTLNVDHHQRNKSGNFRLSEDTKTQDLAFNASSKRNASQSSARSYNPYVQSFKPKARKNNKKNNRRNKMYYANVRTINVSNSTQSTQNTRLVKSLYFDLVNDDTKQDLISTFKVDPFTAELALYITDGNEDACKAFLQTN